MAKKIDVSKYQNKPGDGLSLSVVKLTGKAIKDIVGRVGEYGEFSMFRLIFEDDTEMFMGGSHDNAYLEPFPSGAQFLVDLEDLTEPDWT